MNLSFLPKRVGRILSDVGKFNEMELRRPSATEYDPYKAEGHSPEFRAYPCEGVLSQLKKKRLSGGTEQIEVQGVLLRADNLEVTPEVGDTLVINGVIWSVIDCKTVKPTGVSVLHKLEVSP